MSDFLPALEKRGLRIPGLETRGIASAPVPHGAIKKGGSVMLLPHLL